MNNDLEELPFPSVWSHNPLGGEEEARDRMGRYSDGWIVVTMYSGTHLLPHIKQGTNLIPANGALVMRGR
jgi:hypothetical protein